MDNAILDTFQVTVYNREGIVFSDFVKGVATTNDLGPFSIVSGHTNFISIITGDVLLVFSDETQKNIPAEKGVLRHFENRLEIYIGVGLDPVETSLGSKRSAVTQ